MLSHQLAPFPTIPAGLRTRYTMAPPIWDTCGALKTVGKYQNRVCHNLNSQQKGTLLTCTWPELCLSVELLGLRVESVSKVENGGDLIVVLLCISA